MTQRSGNACHLLVAFLASFGLVAPPVRAQDRALAGQVVDGRGVGLGGATVFVTELARGPRAAEAAAWPRVSAAAAESGDRVLKSGTDGSFGAQVPSGRYRIAVFKSGYEVGLAEFNMTTRGVVEVRMRPARSIASGAKDATGSDGMDWILRRSDGDELRDVVAGPAGETIAAAGRAGRFARPADAAPRFRMPNLNGELTQDFSGSDLLAGESPGPGDASGRTTRVALHGDAGRTGGWRFDGRSGRSIAGLSGGDEARRGVTTTGLGLGLDERLGPDDALSAAVRYSSRTYLFESLDPAGAVDQAQRGAALFSRWDRTLSDRATLFVAASCRRSAIEQADVAPLLAAAGDEEERVDRSFAASTGLSLRAPDHAIDLGLLVRAFRYGAGDGGALLSSAEAGAFPLETADDGVTVTLTGADAWRLTDRNTFDYGLRYQGDPASGAGYVVPRVGLTTTLPLAGDLVLRSVLMYRVLDTRSPGSTPEEGDRVGAAVEARRLGYEIGVAGRPDDRLRFTATLSYRPFQEETEGPARAGVLDESVLVLSDATAGRREMEIEVQRGFGFVQGTLLGSVGRVQGFHAPLLEDGPAADVAAGQARYYLTGLRATIEPTETEVRLDYRSVLDETAAEGGSAASLRYRRVDLAVLQGLPFSPFVSSSRWKLLMAYQGLLLDSTTAGSPWPGSGATSRLSGGVDISF